MFKIYSEIAVLSSMYFFFTPKREFPRHFSPSTQAVHRLVCGIAEGAAWPITIPLEVLRMRDKFKKKD